MLGTAASCIIRDGEMKFAELVVKIADSKKEIAAKSVELSLLTSQKNSIMLSLPTSDGSFSMETFGGLLGCNIHLMCYYMFLRFSSYRDFFFFLSM